MSNSVDRYLLSNVPHIVDLQRTTAQTVKERLDEAMQRMQIVVSDSYDTISVFSIYWKSDNTGAEHDSSLFIKTLSKLENVKTYQRVLPDDAGFLPLAGDIQDVISKQSGSRKLHILHYAGHGIAGGTADTLMITPSTGQDLGVGPEMNMSLLKGFLKDLASRCLGLDVLLVMDSCCAIAGQGERVAEGTRVEFMAVTAPKGLSNRRMDGHTFTMHWCEAFTRLMDIGEPFTCDDLITDIKSHTELEQFPSLFLLHEGWDLPITFRLRPGPTESTLPATVTSSTVVMAFHVEENPDSLALKQLINYLNKSPVPITVLAALPTSSTLLLLRVPLFLQEFLTIPRVTLMLIDS
jgi:hypothetical protein